MTVPPMLLNFMLSGAILLGLMFCFFGYRIFRFVLAVAGFILGASFVAGFGYTLTYGQDVLIILIASVAGGLILGALFLFLYSAGVFLIGAVFGILLFSTTASSLNINTHPILYIAPALAGGILSLLIQRFMIILITSFTGAWVAAMAALYFVSSHFNPVSPEFITSIADNQTYRIVFGSIALGVLGFVTQYVIFPKKEGSPQKIDPANEQSTQNNNGV